VSARAALGPAELAAAIARLPVEIEGHSVETGPVDVPAYYDGLPRPRGVIVLHGAGERGRGESVAWTPEAQAAFAAALPGLVPRGTSTVGDVSRELRGAEPYHRAAIEAAAIDLALRQASTNIFVTAGRPARPVAFCRSLTAAPDPLPAIREILARDPAARIKLDPPERGWSRRRWEALAGLDRVVVVDFKRKGDAAAVARAHAALPEAWLEDPPREALADPIPAWAGRVALDGWVERAADLEWPVLPPGAVNVKAPRLGGPLEALRVLEVCARQGWHAYFGGMFEVDAGRAQARVLASLFTAGAWNDLAPLDDGVATSPIAVPGDFIGFAPRETGAGPPA
jgi:hypothetical protein